MKTIEEQAREAAVEHCLRTLWHPKDKTKDFVAGYIEAAARREELIAKLVWALTGVGRVLVAHQKDGHGNPLCGWDFAVTMALVDSALAKAEARQ